MDSTASHHVHANPQTMYACTWYGSLASNAMSLRGLTSKLSGVQPCAEAGVFWDACGCASAAAPRQARLHSPMSGPATSRPHHIVPSEHRADQCCERGGGQREYRCVDERLGPSRPVHCGSAEQAENDSRADSGYGTEQSADSRGKYSSQGTRPPCRAPDRRAHVPSGRRSVAIPAGAVTGRRSIAIRSG